MAEYSRSENDDDFERELDSYYADREAIGYGDHSQVLEESDNEFDFPLGELSSALRPYELDPPARELPQPRRAESPPSGDFRADISEWCTCGNCQLTPVPTERVCCQEIKQVKQKLQKELDRGGLSKPRQCITYHRGFDNVCLDPDVLEISWGQYKFHYPDGYEGPYDRKMRHTAYRQFQRWIHGFLGRRVRVVIPACAVAKIRANFPPPGNEEDYTFTGFSFD